MSEPEVREITSTGEWLAWREKDWTASRVPALFGLHPYMTVADVAAIFRHDTSTGTGSVPDSPAMRRGRILEPAVAAAIAEEQPHWSLTKATTYHRLPDYRLGCTPDYWCISSDVSGNGLIQCKTCSPQVWESWHGKPPIAYIIQTLTELIVTGRAWGWLAIMVVNNSFPVHYFAVPRHPEAEQRILNAVSAWWKAWDAGEIAEAQAGDIAALLDDGSYKDLSADTALPPLLTERAELGATRRSIEKRLDEIDYQIKNRIGPASTAWLPGWQLTFKAYTRRETVIPEKIIRVLRIKATAGDDAGEDAA